MPNVTIAPDFSGNTFFKFQLVAKDSLGDESTPVESPVLYYSATNPHFIPIKKTAAEIDTTPIVDGQFIVATDTPDLQLYVDVDPFTRKKLSHGGGPRDAATLDGKALDQIIAAAVLAANQASHPIGKILMTVDPANPSTYLGFGTWVAWGSGCVPVGIDITLPEFDTVEKNGVVIYSSGEGQPHNNLQYITCYMWKRTV